MNILKQLPALVVIVAVIANCNAENPAAKKLKVVKIQGADSSFVPKHKELIDTLEVIYMQYACDCPQWLEDSVYRRYYEQRKYELPAVGYYLEPSSSKYAIEPDLQIASNKFRVIGYQRSSYGLPNTGEFMTDNPPKGRVFVYFQWEIIKPYIRYVNGERITFQ